MILTMRAVHWPLVSFKSSNEHNLRFYMLLNTDDVGCASSVGFNSRVAGSKAAKGMRSLAKNFTVYSEIFFFFFVLFSIATF